LISCACCILVYCSSYSSFHLTNLIYDDATTATVMCRVLKSGTATPKDLQLDHGCGCLVSCWVWLQVAKLRNISQTEKDWSGPVSTSLNVVSAHTGLRRPHTFHACVLLSFSLPLLCNIHHILYLMYVFIFSIYHACLCCARTAWE
jgi:hypothetical protein